MSGLWSAQCRVSMVALNRLLTAFSGWVVNQINITVKAFILASMCSLTKTISAYEFSAISTSEWEMFTVHTHIQTKMCTQI